MLLSEDRKTDLDSLDEEEVIREEDILEILPLLQVDTTTPITSGSRSFLPYEPKKRIDELGEPYPMAEHKLWDYSTYRWIDCPRYERCLDYACFMNWAGFSCSRCRYCEIDVAPVPDDPGVGYEKDDLGRWYIPRGFRFPSSSSTVCECGSVKNAGDGMCDECQLLLDQILG